MKCDLHVHTMYSGMCGVPLLKKYCRESYNDPLEVYEKLKRLGMDLVTVTDHDSIDVVEVLGGKPDFFLSEEVTCRMPSGTEAHIGVYDINERQHVAIQSRRNDLLSLLAYLREQDIFFSLNHPFSCLTGRRLLSDFNWFASVFPAVEVLNGHLLPCNNLLADQMFGAPATAVLGGSDGHTIHSVGLAYTEVRGARTREDFLAGLRANRSRALGEHGDYLKLTQEIFSIGFSMIREHPWTAVLLPAAVVIPAATCVNYLMEWNFARTWRRVFMGGKKRGGISPQRKPWGLRKPLDVGKPYGSQEATT